MNPLDLDGLVVASLFIGSPIVVGLLLMGAGVLSERFRRLRCSTPK